MTLGDVVLFVSAVIAFGALAYAAVLLIMVDGIADAVSAAASVSEDESNAR